MVMITLDARQQKNRLLDSVGEGEGEGGMILEKDIETSILSCKK